MSSAITLESLGLTTDELVERVVTKLANNYLSEYEEDEEGERSRFRYTVHQKLQKRIADTVNDAVNRIASESIDGKVEELIRSLTLQKTNDWGEKTGQPVTFVEYLVSRADAWLREGVDVFGKAKGDDLYNSSWRATTTRIAHLIDKHLQYEIDRFAKEALTKANASIANGITEAVKTSLGNVMAGITVQVKK